MNQDDNYIYKEKIKNLLSMFSSKEKVEIINGKLFINDKIVSDKNKSILLVTEIAYLLNIRVLKGVSKGTKLCKLGENKRGNAIQLLWTDVVTGELYPQYFNDTAIRKVVNKRDTGSSKNGLLYRTFVRLTGEIPKASRIPISKILNLFTHAETKTFGHKGDEKIINKTIQNVYIQSEVIEKKLPTEYKTNTPFDALPMYVNRTKQTPVAHQNHTKKLHSNGPLDCITRGIEQNQNALKEISSDSKSNKDNRLRYTYDTEAEIDSYF